MEGVILSIFGVIVTLSGVLCEEIGDINGIVAASVVGFFLLCIVIAMIVVGIFWDKWFSKYQRWRGKIKVPRHIIEQRKKRKQAEKTLSEKSLVANGHGRMPTAEPDSKSWVEGWVYNGRDRNSGREYEEKVNTINLEPEEEYRIEAEIVDNEALDLGPYRKQPDMPNTLVTSVSDQRSEPTLQSQQPYQSEQPQETEQPLYSVVDRASKKSNANGAARHTYEETETSFSALTSDPDVVIM
ncbi:hypothetical protein LOTGIDRAFT_156367 [Lottia gigantea]|uniref:Uncharacterized protein n=1 Tax=Lottia gigantea TaxID=225164 RepID=V4B824_LOTGI|nr:hypothetical protein LOTGIDRAFT_156367 [Lottia gigantea]ESP03806.1 hypothetical protein LOTGIDRAFT_156367 [Lottia gigantea]